MIVITVMALTAIWHLLAAWHFAFFPARTLKRTTVERPPNALAVELFRFLGGLNLALAVLAITACLVPRAALPAAIALAVANGSQALQDVRVRRLGLARGAFFHQILVGDTLFTIAALGIAVLRFAR
jgi:hypothetical protein